MNRVKIVTFVPLENADAVREAMGKAGGGQIGEYSYCSSSSASEGRYIPSGKANPYIGSQGKPEIVQEIRIEVVCGRSEAKAVIAAMKSATPYEQPAYDIYPLVDEDDL